MPPKRKATAPPSKGETAAPAAKRTWLDYRERPNPNARRFLTKAAPAKAKPAAKAAAATSSAAKSVLPKPAISGEERERLLVALMAHPAARWVCEEDVEEMIDEYERWWLLKWYVANPSELEDVVVLEDDLAVEDILPESNILGISKPLDDVWHAHILDTKDYAAFCARHFGAFVHHDPGVPPVHYEDTLRLYVVVFGPGGEDDLPEDAISQRLWPGLSDVVDDFEEFITGEGDGDGGSGARCG